MLTAVETALRASRPTAAFTAACVAAWTVGKPAPAHATAPRLPVSVIGGSVLAVVATTAIVVGVAQPQPSSPTSNPRAALHRRFPVSPRPVLPVMLPRGTFALTASSTAASPVPAKLVEFDFKQAPLVPLMQVFRNVLDTPIWVAYETDAKIDINTHGKRPAIDVLDEVLDKAGASRVEVAAIVIVADGRTDAMALGGEPVTMSFDKTPLNFVLDALEPKLGMPIGRFGAQVIPGTVDEAGTPLVEQSPPVTLELHGVPAGVALEQALIQAGVGYELTTGFVILPR